jgi:hypothetical protein
MMHCFDTQIQDFCILNSKLKTSDYLSVMPEIPCRASTPFYHTWIPARKLRE